MESSSQYSVDCDGHTFVIVAINGSIESQLCIPSINSHGRQPIGRPIYVNLVSLNSLSCVTFSLLRLYVCYTCWDIARPEQPEPGARAPARPLNGHGVGATHTGTVLGGLACPVNIQIHYFKGLQ